MDVTCFKYTLQNLIKYNGFVMDPQYTTTRPKCRSLIRVEDFNCIHRISKHYFVSLLNIADFNVNLDTPAKPLTFIFAYTYSA